VRIVSLVPSVTEALAALDAADRLVGVTRYCVAGAPPGAERVGGTKNPSIDRIVELAPDLVIANAEENRPADVGALRTAGLEVLVTHPNSVADVRDLLRDLAEAVGRPLAVGPLLADLDAAEAQAAAVRPAAPLATLTLVWRKPWRAVGPDTYADDLLRRCGFANVLSGFSDRYPRLDPAFVLGPEVVLLPSEPYAFTDEDLPVVHRLLGADVPHRFIDGQLLTWHGPRTATALRTFSALAADIAAGR
jgi:ABC-type Fe3+-hydroxamate transport system substrate-binding protein